MARIKGWKKTKSGDTIWFSEVSSIDIGKAIKVNKEGKMIGFRDDLYRLNITKNNMLYLNKSFSTQKQATKFAIDYMKSHPRG